MKPHAAMALALALGAILTFGMIHAATHSASFEVVSPSTYGLQTVSHRSETAVIAYNGPFVWIMVTAWTAWDRLHGFAPLTHVDAFGSFYIQLIWIVGPALGFGVFWLVFSRRIPLKAWKSLAILLVCSLTPLALLLTRIFLPFGLAGAEAARCSIVLLLMLYSADQRLNRRLISRPSHSRAASSLVGSWS